MDRYSRQMKAYKSKQICDFYYCAHSYYKSCSEAPNTVLSHRSINTTSWHTNKYKSTYMHFMYTMQVQAEVSLLHNDVTATCYLHSCNSIGLSQ
jgi:hypothetical protein